MARAQAGFRTRIMAQFRTVAEYGIAERSVTAAVDSGNRVDDSGTRGNGGGSNGRRCEAEAIGSIGPHVEIPGIRHDSRSATGRLGNLAIPRIPCDRVTR